MTFKILAIVVLGVLLVLIGSRVYSFLVQENQLNAQLADVSAQLTKAQSEEADMQSDTQYLANPVNLEKELRSRFNYKKPGETMIVIVPAQSGTAASN